MTLQLPPHISYSQASRYEDCSRAWYLSYIREGESLQSWYAPIGTAVHEMIEDYLSIKAGTCTAKVEEIQAEKYLTPLISAQLLIEPDQSKWLAGGPKADPVVGPKALQKVKDCYKRALEFLDGLEVWEVELNATGRLPGLSVELKAFIDIVGEHKKHGPVILDWKTGANKPKNNFQLETYAALLQVDRKFWNLTEDRPLKFKGMWAMLDPNASVARPVDLSAVDPREIGARYEKARKGMESMFIPAKRKFMCKMCFQSPNCATYDLTPRSAYYDHSHHDQPPF